MFFDYIYEMGIIKAETGRVIVKKKVSISDRMIFKLKRPDFTKELIEVVKEITHWFKKQDSYWGNVWKYWWEVNEMDSKIVRLVAGQIFKDIVIIPIVIFSRGKSVKYEFYIKRIAR